MAFVRPLCVWILACLLGVSLTGCGSLGSSDGKASAERITLRDYKSERQARDFELYDKGSGDELAYYSEARNQAPRKFIEPKMMTALFEFMSKNGFATYAQEGPAPRHMDPTGRLRYAFEWKTRDGVRHWPMGDSNIAPALAAERKDFRAAQQMFLELYNATSSYQAVQNASGRDLFDEEQSRLMDLRKTQGRRSYR